jgi:ABC-type glycerol-3-phosphate transport system permease component
MRRLVVFALLTIGSALLAAPLMWMFTISVKTPEGAQKALGAGGIRGMLPGPGEPRLANYTDALRSFGSQTINSGDDAAAKAWSWRDLIEAVIWSNQVANSVVVTTLVVIGTVISCSLVGYAFARMRFRGRGAMFLIMLSTMMLPAQVTMIPLFLLFRNLGWIDTFLPLFVPAFFGSAFFIFMFRQFFTQIGEELLEAARIDGASELGIWWRIMLPLCRPVVAITAIFSFIWTWNDFLGPLIYLHSPENATLALALNSFKGQHTGVDKVHLMMAAAVITMIPCIVLFMVAQRHFVEGLTAGGVKG